MILVETNPNHPIVVIDAVYSEEELALIWNELSFLTSPTRLLNASETGVAVDADGNAKKNALGVFLDDFYQRREFSDILRLNRKLFSPEVVDLAIRQNVFFNYLKTSNKDATLINYYEQKQEYKSHEDKSVFTAITIFCKEPVQFFGGDVVFPDIGVTVENKNNRLVIFPGFLKHCITPVYMKSEFDPFSGFGRYGMAQFVSLG